MLPDDERLTRRRDFAAVYERKRFWAGPLVVLHVRRYSKTGEESVSGPETRRFGFSVSKKVSKAAHDRNRIKRRLREICRKHGSNWQHGFDAVFVARSGSVDASFHDLELAVCQVMRRAGLVATTAQSATAATEVGNSILQPET